MERHLLRAENSMVVVVVVVLAEIITGEVKALVGMMGDMGGEEAT